MTYIWVIKLTIIGPDNGLSPGRCQAIIWTNAGILLIWTLGINFSEILNEIHTFSCKKINLKCHLRNGSNFVSASMCQLIGLWEVLPLTHWGRVTHICVSKLTIIGSDNGLSPDRRQAIIRTNAGIWLIGPFGTNFSEILIEILTFSFEKMCLKVSSVKRRPFCLSLNELV